MAGVNSDDFAILPAWEEAPGVLTAELAATWARLTIYVGTDCATWVEKDGTSRNGIYVSAYPLAEWVAFNWWFLRSELRVSALSAKEWTWTSSSPDSWLHRHNLRAASSGMTWPDLAIVPEGSATCLRWFSRPPEPGGRGLRYLGAGTAWLPSGAVQDGLARFVDAVVDRLRQVGVTSTPLEREWEAIRSARPDETDFADAVARLGFDPYSIDNAVADHVVDLARWMEPPLLAEFLDSVDARRLSSAQEWIADAQGYLREHTDRSLPALPATAIELQVAGGRDDRPWHVGYLAARQARTALGLNAAMRAEVDRLVHVKVLDADSGGIEGYVSSEFDPTLVIPEAISPTRRRFHAAHALGLSILAPSRQRFVIDPASTDLSKAARAFAAELLAPAEGVAEYLTVLGAPTDAAFDAIAQRFETSPVVVRRQYENQLAPHPVDQEEPSF